MYCKQAHSQGAFHVKTYAEGTHSPKLSFARCFQGERSVKNPSTQNLMILRNFQCLPQFLVSDKRNMCIIKRNYKKDNFTFTHR